jgi:hypothetical protein
MVASYNRFFLLCGEVGEKWKFQLYGHVYADRAEISTTTNAAFTQTLIEICLLKQQPGTSWPQLYTLGSYPITPHQDDQQWHDCEDTGMIDCKQIEIPLKKFKTDFFESNDKFTLTIYIKNSFDCRVQFTETNFTALFQTT